MIKLLILFTINIFCITNYAFGNVIAVIDIEDIINKNKHYIEILKEIEVNQLDSSEFLKIDELHLEKKLAEIENSKLLLNDDEINKLIDDYNDKYNQFLNKVNKFNDHYQNQIIKIRKLILEEIIVLSEEYAKKNNIDLILDSSSYLIASNKINITKAIKDEIDKLNLNLEFKNFEEN